MNYHYKTAVRDDDALRASFQELTRKVYGFDFEAWYEKGHWREQYLPHVLTDDAGRVLSNVSVNRMSFNQDGVQKHYIQLGTVMTDPEYRNQGLSRILMENILAEYKGKADGMYLFANDSVLDFYPKFGFQSMEEYEYCMKLEPNKAKNQKGYVIEKVDMTDTAACDAVYQCILSCDRENGGSNPNDGFCMCGNLSLYQFWLAAEYGEMVYRLPEENSYIIAQVQENVLVVYQIIGSKQIELERLFVSFPEKIGTIKLGFTPTNKKVFACSLHKEEDTTLFILGEDLNNIKTDKLMFPLISHA